MMKHITGCILMTMLPYLRGNFLSWSILSCPQISLQFVYLILFFKQSQLFLEIHQFLRTSFMTGLQL